jgi:aerobic C4-dicarboxylate transport protein
LVGNCVATVVIAAWEGDLDRNTAHRVLDGAETVDVTAGLDLRGGPPAYLISFR